MQICQVRVDMFPHEAASKDFMRGLALDFVKGKFVKEDIYKQRDLKLEIIGLLQLIAVQRMRKRPANIMSVEDDSKAVVEAPPTHHWCPHTTEPENESNSCEISNNSGEDDDDIELGNAEEPDGFDPPGESMLEISGRLFGWRVYNDFSPHINADAHLCYIRWLSAFVSAFMLCLGRSESVLFCDF